VDTKVVGCNLPDLTDAPDITHHATAVAAIVGEQNKDRERAKVRIETWRRRIRGARNGLEISQLNAQSEMKDKHRGHCAC
jgi:hypothetical protein